MRRIRNVALATCAALVLTASVGAAAASAANFAFGEYPASVDGNGSSITINVSGVATACSPIDLQGAAVRPTETLATAAADPKECEKLWPWETATTIEMGDCGFILHAPAAGLEKGTADIGPPGCGPIKMTEGEICTRFIAAQTGLPVTFSADEAGGREVIDVHMTAGISYTTDRKNMFCSPGTLVMSTGWQLEAFGPEGVPTDASVVDSVGVYLTGEASESEAKQPRFNAETYPAFVEGTQSASDPHVLNIGGRTFQCGEASWYAQPSAATATLDFDASYSGCSATILGSPFLVSVDMNSCGYGLSVLNAGPPYSGTLGVACANGGDGIEVAAFSSLKEQEANNPFCVYKIAPQSGLTGVGLSNLGSGSGRTVSADIDLTAVSYTRTVGTALLCGKASSTATYSGTSSLHGLGL